MKRLLLAALLLVGTISSAEKIDNFVADAIVEQSGELLVTETIEYDFEGVSRHGIYRDIPFMIKNSGVKKDIGIEDFFVLMDNRPVQWIKSIHRSTHAGKIIRLKIGSKDQLISGKHIYTISYRITKGVLPASDDRSRDAIRWNVVGTGWQVPIVKVIANFTLPASLTKKRLSVSTYTGDYGKTDSSASARWKDPRHLTVTANNLNPHEGLTVELAFAARTLDQHGLENTEATLWQQILGSWHWAALLGFLLFFYKELKKQTGFIDRRSIAVQYQPPKGLSLLQSGLLLDKRADNKDFAAAVLELAQLGYIEIHNDKGVDPVLKRTDKKIKGLTTDQVYLLNHTLFEDGSKSYTFSSALETKARALQKDFSKINNDLYTWSVSDGYMSENPQKTRSSFFKTSLLILLPVFLLAIYTISQDMDSDVVGLILFSSVFIGAGIFIFFQKGIFSKLFGVVFAGMGGGVPLFTAFSNAGLGIGELIFGPLGVFVVLLLAAFYVYRHVGRFTPKGAQIQKHLLGLEMFIKKVKEDEIKRRLKADPLYLDRLLPYAMLFGEAEHWVNFYDLLKVSTPTWYVGNMNSIGSFDSSVNSAATPPSVSSSGGGGFAGGGGFSGGGLGGGGGGSW